MTERERLVRLIDQSPAHFCNGCNESPEERAESVEKLADYLLEQGEIATEPMTARDRLANDLNRICPDLSDTFCGNTSCTSCLSHELAKAGYRKASEVAAEIFAEIEKFMSPYRYPFLADIKKKYTEEWK